MSEDQAVPGRLRLLGYSYLLLFLPFFGFFSPKSAGVIVPLATLMILGGWLMEKRSLAVLRSNAWALVLAVACLVVLSAVWATDRQTAVDRLLKLAVFVPMGMVLVLLSIQSANIGGDRLRKLLLSGFGLGLVLLAWAVVTASPMGDLLHPDLRYIQGPSGENRGAVLLVLLATACLLAARHMVPPPWNWVAVLSLGLLVMFAASQTAFLAFLAWISVFAVASTRLSLGRQLVVWGGALFILAQPFLVLAIEWMDPSRSFDIEVASVGARLDIWIAVAHKAMEAPFFGHGLEATRSITDWANDFHYFNGPEIPHPHNGILQIWIELGFVGALLTAFIWIAVTRSFDQFGLEDQPALLALASSVLVVIGISHGLWQSWWLWGAFGVVAVTLTQVRRERS